MSINRQALYESRFPSQDHAAKDAIWSVLCRDFFQRYVHKSDTVADIGAGHGEFLRHIDCAARIAIDIEPMPGRVLPAGTREVTAASHDLAAHVGDASVDVVFCSNFFEHLPDTLTFLATLREIRRILRPGGRLLVLQPNIRLVGGRYWDFVDHHLPLTERSLAEAMAMTGLDVTEIVPRFLPYTTRSAIPQSPWLVKLYLRVPLAWRFLGGQTWLVASRPQA